MSAHARLSPSSAHRWIQCPGSVRLISEMEKQGQTTEFTSVYADEGTMAHTIAEIKASRAFGLITRAEFIRRNRDWVESTPEEYHADMLLHAEAYVELLKSLAAEYPHTQVMLEQRVDTGVPASWGTADAILASSQHLHVVDYKYGQGIPVTAVDNEQEMLYALGVLDLLDDIFDIQVITLTIHQPRLESVSHFEIKAKDLRGWRDSVAIPAAKLALSQDGYFAPSDEACRFCPAAGECRARMQYMTRRDFGNPELLTPHEIGQILGKLPDIRNWCKAVEERALNLAYHDGVPIPGWKVIKSGGTRKFTDEEQAIQRLLDAGFDYDSITRSSMETLAKLEKLVGGKAALNELMGPLLAKSEGRESLVPEVDERSEVSASSDAAKDFS